MKSLLSYSICFLLGFMLAGCQKGTETPSPQKQVLSSLPKTTADPTKVASKPPSDRPSQSSLLIANDYAPTKLYQDHCSTCHGAEMTGGQGPALKAIGQTKTEAQILTIIEQGHNAMAKIELNSIEAAQLARWLSHHK